MSRLHALAVWQESAAREAIEFGALGKAVGLLRDTMAFLGVCAGPSGALEARGPRAPRGGAGGDSTRSSIGGSSTDTRASFLGDGGVDARTSFVETSSSGRRRLRQRRVPVVCTPESDEEALLMCRPVRINFSFSDFEFSKSEHSSLLLLP